MKRRERKIPLAATESIDRKLKRALRLALICLTFSLSSAYLISSPIEAHADRWRHSASEAEVSAIIRELLTRAELPPQQIKRGAYPLFGEGYAPDAVLPLLSSPCPLLLSCDLLITQLQSQLLTRGYRLVYSDQSPLAGRPIHFAIARGSRPVMALRLTPSATSITLMLHLTPTLSAYRASLATLSPHVTFTFTPELLRSRPEALRELIESGREHLLRVDEVMIKRALIDTESGAPIIDSAQRRAQFGAALSAIFTYVPSTLGVYLDRNAALALDRALADELIARCAVDRRVVVTAGHPDQLLNSLAMARGVRSIELSAMNEPLADVTALEERLRGVSAALVVQGEVALELSLRSARALRALSEWIEELSRRDVALLRVSERAL